VWPSNLHHAVTTITRRRDEHLRKNQVAAKVFGHGDSSNGVNGAEASQWQASRAVRSEIVGGEAPPSIAPAYARNDGMLESLRPQLLVNVTTVNLALIKRVSSRLESQLKVTWITAGVPVNAETLNRQRQSC